MNLIPKYCVALIWSSLILLACPLHGVVITANYSAATDVPVTVASYTATGNTVNITLNFAPPVGTDLTVVNNTGFGPIQGSFVNLAQDQRVYLTHAGGFYQFVVNYYGGTGNDLVLQWANSRFLAWGYNASGQLGNTTTTTAYAPGAVDMTGVLAGKTIITVAAGSSHCLVLCTDGTVATWGDNNKGQLGNNGAVGKVPVAVTLSGVLADKRVIAVAAGSAHNLALCADGTLAAWGSSSNGQLGNNTLGYSKVPVLVDRSGVLAGKTVIGVCAGYDDSFALCSDGTLAAWGANSYGQLGNNSMTGSYIPALVDRSGVLAGKTIASMSAWRGQSLALCTDGTLAAWGSNSGGQLGNGSTISSLAPGWVDRTGVLAGKTIVAAMAGEGSYALCADGTLAGWGWNTYGLLGSNNPSGANLLPALVAPAGALTGKTLAAVASRGSHILALCNDGTLTAWGFNMNGSLGTNNQTDSNVPVLVNTNALRPGERFTAVAAGGLHSLALVAMPPPPLATTLAATGITDTAATLNASVNAQTISTAMSFEYGLTTAYGTTIAATPAVLTGSSDTAASVTLSSLPSGLTYHYRIIATNGGGTVRGEDMTFTTSTLASLTSLTLSGGTLTPAFSSINTSYIVTVPFTATSVSLTPVVLNPGATITIDGVSVESGAASKALDLTVGSNRIAVEVTAANGIITKTYSVTVQRLPQTFIFNSTSEVPLTVNDFIATGNNVTFALNFVPPTGTNLMVINNTGPSLIVGTFSNLAQGQSVTLSFGGINYEFMANYFGGTGNDLVLQSANTRVWCWGDNSSGQLGINTTIPSLVPVPVDRSGVLANKPIVAVAGGASHNVALGADGTVATWGANDMGQLGNNSTTQSMVPVAVDRTGVLASRTVVAIAAGANHTLALCEDGTLAAWGSNWYSQVGNNSSTNAKVPVAVERNGVLANKRVIAVAAGSNHSLVLCADGTLAAWGYNGYGQLGNNSTTGSKVPVAVDASGLLAGKRVTAIMAGDNHNLALCTDGVVVAWGRNYDGELGSRSLDGSYGAYSGTPVVVDQSGLLAGKEVTALAAGTSHSLALCADGTLAAWGNQAYGQLGNSSPWSSSVPVAVDQSGVLADKRVTKIAAGWSSNFALCADGTLAAWGYNSNGALGSNSTIQSNVPVAVSTSNLGMGERFIALGDGSIGIAASPPPPAVTTLAASTVTDTGAILNGSVNAYGTTTSMSFEYGLTTSYGSTAAATPASATGVTATTASQSLGALLSGTTYHYRVVAGRGTLTVPGADMSFTTSTFGTLASLALSSGTVSPVFASNLTSYITTVPNAASVITVTPVAAYANSTVKVNNVVVASGTASNPISLAVGNNVLTVTVAAADGINIKTYNLTATRLPGAFTFNSAATVPVTVADFVATGNAATFALNFSPPVGTPLTAVKNTGVRPIQGTFGNLTQGQRVDLTYAGITYPYWANYYGGTGNDLVLQWANTRVLGWGANTDSQLGNGLTTNSSVPVPPDVTGALAGMVIVAIASGTSHSLALCADGTMAAWGKNDAGQLGNNTYTNSYAPVLVDASGVLAGRTVVAISAGEAHNLALCADGTVASWGYNMYGQLGNGGFNNNNVPVMVNTTGVLAGRTVTAIAAGGSSNLVLCSDGVLAAWGSNGTGQLGNNNTTKSSVPVAVDRTGVLAGKTVAAIAVGSGHCLVLCADGALATWGYNSYGQLGNGSFTDSSVPVSVNTTGVLSGKTAKVIAAGGASNLVLCADGTMAAWGWNYSGQLGNNSKTNSSVPVAVDTGGVLAGKSVIDVGVGGSHCLVACSDGTMAAWGYNSSGQLGNNGTTNSSVPVGVNASGLAAGERFSKVAPGSAHSICLIVSPPRPVVATVTASGIGDTAATMKGSVNACGTTTAVSFQYGLTSSYGLTIAATPATVSGATTTAASATPGNLLSGTTYHYRVVATNAGGTALGGDMTFTTSAYCTLASLNVSRGTLAPGFTTINAGYAAFVPFTVSNITVTPVTVYATSTVKVNGATVASGTTSGPIALAVGNNPISIVITAQDGTNTMTYTVTVTRLPEVFTFNSAASVPVTVNHFVASDNTAAFALTYAPTTGTSLMVVKNTGTAPIQGTFSNLAQGQTVRMIYDGTAYSFTANYFGGTGNDLVLQWANTRLLAWGANASGQLGNNSTADSSVPVAVEMGGALSGRTLISTTAGAAHSLALGVDGTLTAWGSNSNGRLGNNSTTSSTVPVGVDRSGTLGGKITVALAAGASHSLALCSDGTLAGWGYNTDGQLGNAGASYSTQSTPSPVSQTGVLAGKSVIAVAAGSNHSLALCADGAVAVWGDNYFAQMGNTTVGNDDSKVPLLVNGFGALAGKQVKALAAGANFSLALCADGTLVAWGSNSHGQFGNNTTTYSTVPVSVNQTGVLAGKTVTAIAAGGVHCLALCSDGTLAAWGSNYNGQLGNGTSISSSVPLLVTRTGVLTGKTVSAIHAGDSHSLVLCSDGTLAAWGYNTSGQLGDGTTISRSAPVLVSTTALRTGERIIGDVTGSSSSHNFALVAIPPAPVATILAASSITDTGATLNAGVYPNGTTTTVSFEYGLTTSYGSVVAAAPATTSGTGMVAVNYPLVGLLPGFTYHYRAIIASGLGNGRSEDMTFTTSTLGTLSGLTQSTGTLAPAFSYINFNYIATVPFATNRITVTPVAAHASSTVKVNAALVASGIASGPITLVVGDNPITTVVTSADGINTQTYNITVNRLPEVFTFNSESDIPVTAKGFSLAGITANFTLKGTSKNWPNIGVKYS